MYTDDQEALYLKAEASSIATIKAASALTQTNPDLKVYLMTRPPRIDKMREVSEYANQVLQHQFSLIHPSLRKNFHLSHHTIPTSTEMEEVIYGPANHRGFDGVHMKGKGGVNFLTNSILAAIRLASSPSQSTLLPAPVVTHNRFSPIQNVGLNY